MKKITLLVALLAILISACTKNYYGDDETYHVDGITNITLNPDRPSYSSYLQVTYHGSDQESVELSYENVPNGLYIKIATPSGYPSFSTSVQFYDSSAAVGTYTVNLVATGQKSGRRVLPFKVNIESAPQCAQDASGQWSGYNPCNPGNSYFIEHVSVLSAAPNRIQFDNFENSGITVYANLNCTTRTVTVPAQTINGVTYSGSGNFYISPNINSSSLRVYYTKVIPGGVNTSCQLQLTR